MKGVYHATKKLCSEPRKKFDMVVQTSCRQKEEVRQRWKEQFVEVPNRSKPEQVVDVISDVEVKEETPLGPITKTEIRSAILSMSAGTAPDIDGIIVELL